MSQIDKAWRCASLHLPPSPFEIWRHTFCYLLFVHVSILQIKQSLLNIFANARNACCSGYAYGLHCIQCCAANLVSTLSVWHCIYRMSGDHSDGLSQSVTSGTSSSTSSSSSSSSIGSSSSSCSDGGGAAVAVAVVVVAAVAAVE